MVEISYDEDGLLQLSTLAAATAITAVTKVDAGRSLGFRVAKLNIAATVEGKTAGEGGIMWGLAANMTAVEIAEALVADPQASSDNPDHPKG